MSRQTFLAHGGLTVLVSAFLCATIFGCTSRANQSRAANQAILMNPANKGLAENKILKIYPPPHSCDLTNPTDSSCLVICMGIGKNRNPVNTQ